jgi:hypothetical protein
VRSEFALESERINVLQANAADQVLSKERLLKRPGGERDAQELQMHEDDLLALRAQHRKQRASWAGRLGTVMSDVVQAAHHRGDERVWLEPLGGLAVRLAQAERVEEFMSLLAVMMKRLTLPQARRALVSQALTPDVLRTLFVSLGVLTDVEHQVALHALDDTTQETLTLLLGHLDGRHLEVTLEALGTSTESVKPLRAPLLDVVRSEGAGHETLIGESLSRMPANERAALISWLIEQGAPGLVGLYAALPLATGQAALEIVGALLATPHNPRHNELLPVIGALVWDDRVETRRKVLELVVQHRYEPFIPDLLARTAHPDFNVLSMEERREHFALLRALSAPGAEQVCVTLLALDGSGFSQEMISSQLLAIEDLARHGYSQEAMQALDESRRHHPLRSREVQHAAQQAFTRFCARHGISPGGSDTGGA